MKNYYAILEVPVGCSLEEIRQSYRRLVQEHLDDEAVFADLKESYEVLSSPTRRAEYDQAAWGETFDTQASFAATAESGLGSAGLVQAGRCPMGAEAQCPVLQGRSELSDKFCLECGYAIAGLSSGAGFETSELPSPAERVWLEHRNGQTHPIRPGSNLLGRDGGDILIPDKTVSRNHARLELGEDGTLTVEDLSSTNGTEVGNEALMPHVPRSLSDGDALRFGSVSLTLHLPALDADAASTDAPAEPSGSKETRAQVVEIGEGRSDVFPLAPGITSFGRRPENTVVITGDLYVSGVHAQISANGDVFILTDIGSTNGTLLNGERLKINTPVTLDSGDEILIGGTAMRFERLGANAEPPAEESAEEAEPTEEVLPDDPEAAPADIHAEADSDQARE